MHRIPVIMQRRRLPVQLYRSPKLRQLQRRLLHTRYDSSVANRWAVKATPQPRYKVAPHTGARRSKRRRLSGAENRNFSSGLSRRPRSGVVPERQRWRLWTRGETLAIPPPTTDRTKSPLYTGTPAFYMYKTNAHAALRICRCPTHRPIVPAATTTSLPRQSARVRALGRKTQSSNRAAVAVINNERISARCCYSVGGF